jgi:hypothetical protein
MIYLLDANVLITAHNTYYPIDNVPEFWEWLFHQAGSGTIKLPSEVFEEIKEGSGDPEKDKLFGWCAGKEIKKTLTLDEKADMTYVQKCLADGYAKDLNDVELDAIGRDPFLIAAAMRSVQDRVVVTNEVSKPKAVRQNRKIPDVCDVFKVTCITPFQMLKTLDFKTNWKK